MKTIIAVILMFSCVYLFAQYDDYGTRRYSSQTVGNTTYTRDNYGNHYTTNYVGNTAYTRGSDGYRATTNYMPYGYSNTTVNSEGYSADPVINAILSD